MAVVHNSGRNLRICSEYSWFAGEPSRHLVGQLLLAARRCCYRTFALGLRGGPMATC